MAEKKAIVIGGGIAGMSAAKVLADHFDKVILLERDLYPDTIGGRRGVPQGRMFHTLLERGRREIEDIFPGFHKLLDERKMPKVSFGFNCALMTPRGWTRNVPIPIQRSLFCTRGMLETTMRDLFKDDPRIETHEQTNVMGLVAEGSGDRARCTGVRALKKGADAPEVMLGDLIIDASGANSKAAMWLKEVGVEPPKEETLDPLLTYGGQLYRLKEGLEFPKEWWWTHGAFIQRVPPSDNKAAHLIRQESGLWLLTLVAGDGLDLPEDEDGIADFVGGMRSPLISGMLPYFEPVDIFTRYRLPSNRWRYYEKWEQNFPGFLAIGASTCVFNPNQGQGMSVAAADAGILKACLQKTASPAALPKLFFKEQAHFQKNAYRLAVANDLKFTAVQGKRTIGIKLFNWYREQQTAAGLADTYVARKVGEVDLLLKPVSSLFHPVIMARTLFARLFLFWRANPTQQESVAALPPPPAEIPKRWRNELRTAAAYVYRTITYKAGLAR